MKNIRLYCGVEIELINNENLNSWTIGEYHSPEPINDFWSVEEDSSLYKSNEFGFGGCGEFVSRILKGKKDFNNAIENFITLVSRSGKYELKEVICFNKSCGCHLHLGLSNSKRIYPFIDYEILEELRLLFFDKLNKSKVLKKPTIEKIKEHYFREFAEEGNKDLFNRHRLGNRYLEFNKNSEVENQGFEWRSFNLYGVRTWGEFREVLKIGFQCLEFLFKKRTKGYTLKNKPLRITKKEIRDFIEEQEKTQVREIDLNDLIFEEFKINEWENVKDETEEKIIDVISGWDWQEKFLFKTENFSFNEADFNFVSPTETNFIQNPQEIENDLIETETNNRRYEEDEEAGEDENYF